MYIISELRWYLLCKHMAESDKLPFTLEALRQHVLRVHIQAAQDRVCGQASIVPQEPQLDSLQNGYHKESYAGAHGHGQMATLFFLITYAISFPKMYIFHTQFIHSFITEIYIAPLQGYYSEALPTLARLKIRVLRLA